MSAYINYLIEANLGLALLLLAYVILLRKETDFSAKRLFLLVGIFACVLFPFLHLQTNNLEAIPSIGNLVSTYWLPEVTIIGAQTEASSPIITGSMVLSCIPYIYALALIFFLIRFLVQLIGLVRIIATSKGYQVNNVQIVESNGNQIIFSFFNFIFIGNAHSLSATDKNKIIQHETVHAKQLHSIDIVLLNVLGIFFWFNPLIKRYKKIFVQLHEFEADARAVENTEVNEYCSLLAKVALQSADYTLANHFNQSLTLKRIEMMRTLKHKIRPWKLLTLASVIFFLFFVVACQDQLADANFIAKNSSNPLDVPKIVQEQLDNLQKNNPGNTKYTLIELNPDGQSKLDEMKPDLERFQKNSNHHSGGFTTIQEEGRSFVIIEEMVVDQLADLSSTDGVYTIVEEMVEYPGGLTAFYKYISENLTYPDSAKANGIQGRVFLEFVVNTDGSVSDVKTVKGIGGGCEEEAIRVMRGSPAWIPGKVGGKIVRTKMVMPINFQLG